MPSFCYSSLRPLYCLSFHLKVRFLFCHCHFFLFMPFPVLFPCHIFASVFHLCPRVQSFVLRFRFYSLSFCHLEISHRKWPLPCQKTQHQSYTPLTWPTIHWTTKVHASKSTIPLSLSSSLSIYLPLSVFTFSVSACVSAISVSEWVFFVLSCLSFAGLLC